MTTVYLAHDIECEEGRRYRAYPDPLTGAEPWTCGVGSTGPDITCTTVWTDFYINQRLQEDITKAKALLDECLPWWTQLSDIRQDVLVQMTFQMGIGWTSQFPHAVAAMKSGDWQTAHDEMLNSEWARTQSPARAKREATQMLTNVRSWA